jgi:protein O-GlcNAc transferase
LEGANAAYHYGLGVAYKAGDRLKHAEKTLHRALKLDPKLVLAHVQLGNLLADLGDLEAAERELGRATDLDPRNVDALCDLASFAGWIALVRPSVSTGGRSK